MARRVARLKIMILRLAARGARRVLVSRDTFDIRARACRRAIYRFNAPSMENPSRTRTRGERAHARA